MEKHVLVIQEDEELRGVWDKKFKAEGYHCVFALTGDLGFKTAQDTRPDLILLDVMLPDTTGFDLCKRLKGSPKTSRIPIIMLTSDNMSVHEVIGLEMGADDFLMKPFDYDVVMARIRRLTRGRWVKSGKQTSAVVFKELVVDPRCKKAFVNDKEIILSPLEFRILLFLANHRGDVFSRDELVKETWKESPSRESRAIDVHISILRKKLGSAGKYIETVRGSGYRFSEN